MIRHYIVLRGSQQPLPWTPELPAEGLPKDCLYLGRVLGEMEGHLRDQDLHCYLTWDSQSLPEYGSHVIAILVGEECGLIPRYARHVRMVGRVLSQYPYLGVRRFIPVTFLKVLLVLKFARNWFRHVISWIRFRYTPSTWPTRVLETPHIIHLPWGSADLVDMPMKPVDSRLNAYFFSGGINTGTEGSFRKWLGTPKVLARKSMINAIRMIEQNHPSLSGGTDRLAIHQATSDLRDAEEYAQRLMDSKVCLAPRGTTADTWRLFEGIKSGCIVISNLLPNEWYYHQAPVIQIEDWNELEDILVPLLKDDAALNRLQMETLTYWNEVCGEKAVGRYIARQLSIVAIGS